MDIYTPMVHAMPFSDGTWCTRLSLILMALNEWCSPQHITCNGRNQWWVGVIGSCYMKHTLLCKKKKNIPVSQRVFTLLSRLRWKRHSPQSSGVHLQKSISLCGSVAFTYIWKNDGPVCAVWCGPPQCGGSGCCIEQRTRDTHASWSGYGWKWVLTNYK